MDSETKIGLTVAGIVGLMLTVWLLFWGTVGTIVIHFVKKFW
jgi:hypothetical protein